MAALSRRSPDKYHAAAINQSAQSVVWHRLPGSGTI